MSIDEKIQETDCSRESDADLLTWVSLREEDRDGACRAWGEFYNRYVELLSHICLKKYKGQVGEQGVEDLVNDTFLRVFESAAGKFKTNETDPQKQRYHIGVWLGVIAHRLFLMRLQDKERLSELDGFDPESTDFDPQTMSFALPGMGEDSISPERIELCKRLQEVLNDLTNRERIVLLTRAENHHLSIGKQQFHSDDLEQLASDFCTTKENIRQIYHRTLQKVKKQLS